MSLTLHGYWRSGTSYRTRIALNLKGLRFDTVPVDLVAAEQATPAYRRLNPQGLVPALEIDDLVLTQSPAIMEWLEEVYPAPPLLPAGAVDRARVRAMAAVIGCDIHPLNNLRVLTAVKALAGLDRAAVDAWAGGWIGQGFAALESLIQAHGAGFCFGAAPTLADCYLMPQVYSARRFNVDLAPYPHIRAVDEAVGRLAAFAQAHPDNQPDAPSSGR